MHCCCVYPSILKRNKIIPIHKCDKKNKVENCKPIAISSIISKITEKRIKISLISFIEKHQYNNPKQFGFKSNVLNIDKIINLTSMIYDTFVNSQCSAVVLLNLAKAFDTINHKLLFKKSNENKRTSPQINTKLLKYRNA